MHALRSVIREGISNVIKHSQATRAAVSLTLQKNKMHLLIADDGRGFDTDVKSGGSGLSNFRNRLQPFGGEVKITSSHKGTEISAAIPLEEKANCP